MLVSDRGDLVRFHLRQVVVALSLVRRLVAELVSSRQLRLSLQLGHLADLCT